MEVTNPAARDADARGTRDVHGDRGGGENGVAPGERPLKQWCLGPHASLARTAIGVLTLARRPDGPRSRMEE
ncbi:MAG: hypothetical protein OXH52_19405 [Gammaproteobacteria bacterium]|nr:hypothetical protein [Gammaproteobacteria bacterium]